MDPDLAIPTLALWVTIPALDPDPQKSGIVKPLTYTHQIVDQRWGRAFSGRHPCSCSIPGTHILTSNINPENIERIAAERRTFRRHATHTLWAWNLWSRST